MRPVPIMFVSDDPSTQTGLGRVTRDLARLVAASPRWRVATLGLGGTGSRHFPWAHYHMHKYPNGGYEYGELSLAQAWDDFTLGTDGQGVVMTIFDVTRMLWLARPEHIADDNMRQDVVRLRQKVRLWGYFMQDHEGPQGALTRLSKEVLLGYDRILMTSPFGVDVVRATIGDDESAKRGLEWMPHGLWMDIFTPSEKVLPFRASADGCPDERSSGRTTDQRQQEDATDPLEASVEKLAKFAEYVEDATDPLEKAVASLGKWENVQAAVTDLVRLKDEGKI